MATVITMPKLQRQRSAIAGAQPDRQPPQLIDVLAKLHIIPFTEKSVREYLHARLEDALRTPPIIETSLGKKSLHITNLQNVYNNGGFGHADWINPYGATWSSNYLVRVCRKWSGMPVQTYEELGGKIPEQVRDTMERIKAEAPDAIVDVVALEDETHSFYDPFLRVSGVGGVYFVAVWDEEGYVIG